MRRRGRAGMSTTSTTRRMGRRIMGRGKRKWRRGRRTSLRLRKVPFHSFFCFFLHGREVGRCGLMMETAPAVKTNGKASANGKKRGAPAAAAPPAKKGRKAAALPVDVVEVVAAKAKGRGRKAAPAAAAVEAEEEEEEVKEVAVAKSKRGKKEVVEVEIAETQDVYMHDVCVESVPAARKMGALVDRRKELLRLEEMRKIEAEERLEEFVRNSEAIQTGMSSGKKWKAVGWGWAGLMRCV